MGMCGERRFGTTVALVDFWLEAIAPALEAVGADEAHRERVEAIEDSGFRLVGAGMDCPASVRKADVAAFRSIVLRTGEDAADPFRRAAHPVVPMDRAFADAEERSGTLSAVLFCLAGALLMLEDSLGGAVSGTADPSEIVHIPKGEAREWTKAAMLAMAGVERCVLHAEGCGERDNLAVVRDAWNAVVSLAVAMAQMEDYDGIDARLILTRLCDVAQAASRASSSLIWRGYLDAWSRGDPFHECAAPALEAIKAVAARGTDLVAEGLVTRGSTTDRIAWRGISRGRVGIADAEILVLARSSAALIAGDLPEGQTAEAVVAGLLGVARAKRMEWARG